LLALLAEQVLSSFDPIQYCKDGLQKTLQTQSRGEAFTHVWGGQVAGISWQVSIKKASIVKRKSAAGALPELLATHSV